MSGAFGLSPEGAKQGIKDYRAARAAAGSDEPATEEPAALCPS